MNSLKNNFEKTFEQYESEARGYCRSINTVFASARGSIMADTQGNEYIDFLAACGSLNYGHNDPDMSAALVAHIQQQGIAAGLDLYSTAKERFLSTFHTHILRPRGLDYRVQFTGPTGTNAVEAALKLARKVTGRTNIISFTNGFHGVSLGALATTGNKYNRMGAMLPGVSRFPFEDYMGRKMDTAAYLDHMLSDPSGGIEPPAAFILETVQGEGGLNAVSAAWMQKIAGIARKHGALLIIDDIQAGCGRTGSFFSFEPLGVRPDIVTLSKSISGFGLPMAIVLIKPEHDKWLPAEHNGTFRGNNHAFITAAIMLEKFWRDDAFSREVAEKAAIVTQRLQLMANPVPGAKVKGRGMMQGLSLPHGDMAARVCKKAFEKGLIVETSGPHSEVVKILAALTIPQNLLEHGLQIIHECIDEIRDEETTKSSVSLYTGNIAHNRTLDKNLIRL